MRPWGEVWEGPICYGGTLQFKVPTSSGGQFLDLGLGVRDVVAVGIDPAPSFGARGKSRYCLTEPQLQKNKTKGTLVHNEA